MDNLKDKMQHFFTEGAQLLRDGKPTEALECFKTALKIDPFNALINLYTGTALHTLERYEEAVSCYRQALDDAPRMGEIHNNLGNSLMALGRFSEAVDSFSSAAKLLASSPVPLTTRATALQAIGKIADAESDCRKALALDPSFAAAHWNLSLNLLLQGRYEEGWQEYEWRWLKPDFTSPCRHTDIPLWDGSPLSGRTILLHAEQGFGDAIQFVRYAPMVANLGGAVIVECHPQLVQLIKGINGIQGVVPFGAPLPPLSFQAPLLSLPRIFGTTLPTIPSQCPYLATTHEYRTKWAALTNHSAESLRVGLVWAGKSYPDPLRSCCLEEFASLATIPDIAFYSLQLGNGSKQASYPPSGMTLIDLTENIQDFADTAALIERLDFVITIDTAVAHLAGALGIMTFVLLPFAPDWRWLLDREDSPWYPSMRIFRQIRPGDWRDVMEQLHAALKAVAEQKKSSGDVPQRISFQSAE